MTKIESDKKKEAKNRLMAITIKAVLLKDDKVLLLHRSKGTVNEGKWDLPGGHIDFGETAHEALKREIKEETGLEAEVGEIIYVSEFPKDHPLFKTEKRSLRYLAYSRSGEVKLNDREHDACEWLSLDDAIAKMTEENGYEKDKKETLKAAKEYLRMKQALGGWQRAIADLENYKKRAVKANEEFRKYCMEDFVLELLPVIDNFEMSTDHIPSESKSDGWVTGIMHIKNQLENALSNRGIQPIEAKAGDELDEAIHEVITTAKPGGRKKAVIKKILKKGYRIGERVIRPVVVETE